MKLEGLHHITMITGDAQRVVDFYADLLGLRLVKKTVNFDAPEAYHLYFGDERGAPGSILTWFEFAGAAPGRAGDGMIHTLELGVASAAALDFWAERLTGGGHPATREGDRLDFADPDGLGLALVVADDGNPRLVARHPDVPAAHAITGAQGARAYAVAVAGGGDDDRLLADALGFARVGEAAYRLDGEERHFRWAYDSPPRQRGRPGAGTVHHIAWASRDEDQLDWRERAVEAGAAVTDVIDRDYFKSIYFRAPGGILLEIATLTPGFAVDEDEDHLGEALRLPRRHEHLRPVLERVLRPVVNPRAARRDAVAP
ncbi:MAG: VOC family protein [Solirubrobacteraceae bacterium]